MAKSVGEQDGIQIGVVEAFSDNYVWILGPSPDRGVAVLDPGSAGPVLEYLQQHEVMVTAVLATHHHGDHTAGIGELTSGRDVPVYGPAGERIAGVNRAVAAEDRVLLPELGLTLEVLGLPGHTAGHIGFLGPGFVFTGDALFAGGCGRVFEGTAAEMYASLSRLAALPGATRVYCAHEYTLANLSFAITVEPENQELVQRLQAIREQRSQGQPSVPSTIACELATNPFLRCEEPALVAAASRFAGRDLEPGVEVFAAIRKMKDNWRQS